MRLTVPLAAALLLAACSAGPTEVPGPVEQSFTYNGLEQQLTVTYSGPDDPTPGWFHLRSRIVNRTDAPVAVRVQTCWLDPRTNLRTRASFDSFAIPSCVQPDYDGVLDPGEASPTVWFSGHIERPGRYRIDVRQLLDADFWGTVEVVQR